MIDRDPEERQLAAVMEIAEVINSRLDLDSILSTISRELSKVIDYDIGCVAIYEKDENCLYIRHVTRRSGNKTGEGRYVPLDETNLVGWVAIHKKPILRENIPADTRFNEIMKEDNLTSDIVVPLIAKDSLIGTVNIGRYGCESFTQFDLELVTKFSQLTSIAIENSQLLEELKGLGDKYRKLMDNASDVIVILNVSGEIVECNKSMYKLFGYSPEELIGKDFSLFSLPSYRAEAKKTFYRVMRGEIDHIVEIPYTKKNGELVYMEVGLTIIKIRAHPYILAIAHDVTERKTLEEKIILQNRELREINKKLRELDQLKSEFLGRISHELRTPLSVIMAYASALIEDGGSSMDTVTRNEFLQIIDSHSNKLLHSINDLLDLSKIEISETMLDITEASINEIIRLSINIVEPFAIRSNVSIKSELDTNIGIIRFDPLRIRQVCVNLLNNGVKFNGSGGSVIIASQQADDCVIVSVSDTGPGIEQEDIPLIFENFMQLDGGATRSKSGMGIGLRLVKHYVDLHGGRIWVESTMGSGSTFHFTLPLQCGTDDE